MHTVVVVKYLYGGVSCSTKGSPAEASLDIDTMKYCQVFDLHLHTLHEKEPGLTHIKNVKIFKIELMILSKVPACCTYKIQNIQTTVPLQGHWAGDFMTSLLFNWYCPFAV